MVGTHFAAVNGIYLAHTLFNKRVTRFTGDSVTSSGGNNGLSIPGQPGIVHHALGALLGQKCLGQ